MNIQGKYIKYEAYAALQEKCADLSERLNLIIDLMEYAQQLLSLEQKKKRKLAQQCNARPDDIKHAADIAMLLAALEAASYRIAELEAREVKLPEYRNSPDMHTKQFYEAIGFNQGLDVFIEALRAAGIGVKGE
ncbi:hypothetical protein M8W81_000846 [Salmonella enterica]|nr:hypothetical protein [Salmonella enterica]EJF6007464.1 hypothetical protein [Salmonella enterica]EJF6161028.1 hypothetical protein [Salmonella enterica]